ncbi:hypothetical protein Tco_0070301, partial [Tanacetum coccineum]
MVAAGWRWWFCGVAAAAGDDGYKRVEIWQRGWCCGDSGVAASEIGRSGAFLELAGKIPPEKFSGGGATAAAVAGRQPEIMGERERNLKSV